MNEIWKDIPGYEGKYQISNTGKIKSFAKYSEGKILTPFITRGYASIGLCDKSFKKKTFLVHRLVALLFVPNPNGYKEINHKDENKLNNSSDNLEWCTREYNMSYGNARLSQGISCGKPIAQFTINGLMIAKYYSAEFAASVNKIDGSSIIRCCKGKRKYAGGYAWQYTDF